jgi:hypothetical protein
MGRDVTQPLTVRCSNLADVRTFLAGCRGVSGKEQFGREDYWQPPEDSETRRKGDCDDLTFGRGASSSIWDTTHEWFSEATAATDWGMRGCSSSSSKRIFWSNLSVVGWESVLQDSALFATTEILGRMGW